MFTIEKGIPLPPVTRGPETKYPFADMEVDDSFFAQYKSFAFADGTPQAEIDAAIAKAQQALYNSVARTKSAFVKANAGKEFTLRKVEGGIRVWRTA